MRYVIDDKKRILLHDDASRLRAVIDLRNPRPIVLLLDALGGDAGVLAFSETGSLVLTITDPRGTPRWAVVFDGITPRLIRVATHWIKPPPTPRR